MFIENDRDKAIYNLVSDKTLFIRHGTDCWGYGMCAAGTIDLVIEKDLEIWDIAAARAIILKNYQINIPVLLTSSFYRG